MRPTQAAVFRAAAVAVAFVISLSAVELALRVQPFLILIQHDRPAENYSEVLHHHGGKGDAFAARNSYGCRKGESALRVLVLGDSWAEEGSYPAALGSELAARLRRCVEIVNAGVSSYSPSLYLLKARVLASTKPDMIVANIEETDIGDEWYRYRLCELRREGRLEAVRPRLDRAAFSSALFDDGGSLWHIRRFFRNLALQVRFPKRRSFLTPYGDPWHLMQFHLSPAPLDEFPAETDHFARIVAEMTAGLGELVGPEKVFVTHHPQFLSEIEEDGLRYNRLASRILRSSIPERLIDASERMSEIHGAASPFKWPQDPLSHLNREGYERYGRFVGREIARRVAIR